MASNGPYTIRNTSNSVVMFSINHDDNYINSFALKPGQYFSFTDISDNFYISSDLEKERLLDDILAQVGKSFSMTDKDGNAVDSDDYREDNPLNSGTNSNTDDTDNSCDEVIPMPNQNTVYEAGKYVEIYAESAGVVTLTYAKGSTIDRFYQMGFTRLHDSVIKWSLPVGSTFIGTVTSLK